MFQSGIKTAIYTVLALIAFAANSVLCRLALGEQSIDAGSFTVIRLVSGVLILLLIWRLTRRSEPDSSQGQGNWFAGAMLFLYAIAFSYAYISLDTGTGALILFGMVQITMITYSLFTGQKLGWREWAGLFLASSGLVWLLAPSINTPALHGFILMAVAGIAWGAYTLKGRGSVSPLADTCFNFVRTLPLVGISLLLVIAESELSYRGVLLAVASGAIASGVGYAIWYQALAGLSAIQAGVLQLLVPVIAALGGVLFAAEPVTLRLVISGLLVLGGILLVLLSRHYKTTDQIE